MINTVNKTSFSSKSSTSARKGYFQKREEFFYVESHEINMALEALKMFMIEDEKAMRCFVTVIKQLLDYVVP